MLCVSAPEAQAGALRIENALLVRADAEGHVELDDRLFVSARVLGDAIEKERAVVGEALEPRRAAAQARAKARLREARRLRRAGARIASVPHLAAHAGARAWAATLAGARRATRWTAGLPDQVATRWGRSQRFLATKEGRARFRKALLDPHGLTAEEKAITLFVGTTSLLATLLVLHVAVTLSVPEVASSWRAIVLLFGYAYITSLGIPGFIEPALFGAALVIGKPAALVVVVVAKSAAAWMVFFVGDAVNHSIRKKAETSKRYARFLDWSERFAKRFGTAALALFIATPGLPDVIALYVFGALHMRLPQFILGVAIGSTVLNAVVLFGVGALMGI